MEQINAQWIREKFDVDTPLGADFLQFFQEVLRTDTKAQDAFKEWHTHFTEFYVIEELTEELYGKHNLLLVTIGTILLHHRNMHETLNFQSKLKYLEQLYVKLQIPCYFFDFETLGQKIIEIDTRLQVQFPIENIPIDLFSEVYQCLITNLTRHPQGEFYTHPILAELMANEVYINGLRVLDPACGSGTFLLTICKKIHEAQLSSAETREAILNLVGIDVNPLACIMARANLLLFNTFFFDDYWTPAVFCANTLDLAQMGKKSLSLRGIGLDQFIKNETKKQSDAMYNTLETRFDLVIGNPPWVVLNGIHSKTEQQKIKQLGQSYGILQGGRLATSTELTSIFCEKTIRDFLKSEGCLFFVIPASIANAAQHELFRQFNGCKHIEFWAFDKDVFRIHNLCLKLVKGESSPLERWQIPWKIYHVNLNPLNIELLSNQTYIPSYLKFDSQKDQMHVGRLTFSKTPQENLTRLLAAQSRSTDHFSNTPTAPAKKHATSTSPYQKLFRQGASFVPRNLMFVKVNAHNTKANTVTIIPAEDLVSKKYSTWEFHAYESAEVEAQYIFNVAKSTGMIPFGYLKEYPVFLPLSKTVDGTIEMNLPAQSLAQKHYARLKELYSSKIKHGATVTDLDRRIDYGHALTDPRQCLIPKIIFAGIGSITKAAILKEPYFIDTSLYFFHPNSLEEAYFLLGFLNSPLVTEYVKTVGSTGANGSLRNIHKHPLDISLPRYNPEEQVHQELAHVAQTCEKYVEEFASLMTQNAKDSKVITLKSIQNRLMHDATYLKYTEELNALIKRMKIV